MIGSGIRTAVLGASGYTGYELVRLLSAHDHFTITALAARQHAGHSLAGVFGGFAGTGLPRLVAVDDIDYQETDAVFAALPHCTAHAVIKRIFDCNPRVKLVDLSADFRFDDTALYEAVYGRQHAAAGLQKEALYGLTERAGTEAYRNRRLVANPGCYPTATLLALEPLLAAELIWPDGIIINAASGTTGAGRVTKTDLLFAEHDGAFKAYAVGGHRHAPEIDQMLTRIAGRDVVCSFTPHLLPASRGILTTISLEMAPKSTIAAMKQALASAYRHQAFIRVYDDQTMPDIRQVRGTNCFAVNVFADRIAGRAIVIAAIDNLLKGASGQAIQNMNLLFGLPGQTGLGHIAYPT